jgi:hypothetical protein
LYEGAYLNGVIAGKMSKTKTLGFIASFPVPEVIRNINAFTLGAQSVNPAIKTKVIWVNSWYDPAKERQAAETLVAQGADVMAQNTDSPATLQVAQEKGVYAFGWDSDMSKFAPKAHLTAATNNWGPYYTERPRPCWPAPGKPAKYRGGLKEGMVKMSGLNAVVPADAAKIFEEKKAALTAGHLEPFTGPIKDQSGAIKYAGKMPERLADDELLRARRGRLDSEVSMDQSCKRLAPGCALQPGRGRRHAGHRPAGDAGGAVARQRRRAACVGRPLSASRHAAFHGQPAGRRADLPLPRLALWQRAAASHPCLATRR